MTADIERQLREKGHSVAPTPRKGSTAAVGKAGPSAKQQAAETAARLEAVGVGRAAGVHTAFGVAVPYRRFTLQNEEQAALLDAAFYSITGANPST